MLLHPHTKIIGIDTGNPYIGLVDIYKNEKFVTVAKDFPNHAVFVKGPSAQFPTSVINNDAIHVYYNEHGHVIGAELMKNRILNSSINFRYRDLNLFPDNLHNLTYTMKVNGISYVKSDYGVYIEDLGLKYYCSNFNDVLNCEIDAVYVAFT